jgi:hypothetical protein
MEGSFPGLSGAGVRRDGDNIDRLLDVTVAHLPEGEGV